MPTGLKFYSTEVSEYVCIYRNDYRHWCSLSVLHVGSGCWSEIFTTPCTGFTLERTRWFPERELSSSENGWRSIERNRCISEVDFKDHERADLRCHVRCLHPWRADLVLKLALESPVSALNSACLLSFFFFFLNTNLNSHWMGERERGRKRKNIRNRGLLSLWFLGT